MTTTLRLKNDKRLRDKFYTPESYQHPAKGHLGLWQAIIEKYTKPGETVLDPMAGVGATMLASLMGRNVICVELEPHFIAPMKASWAKMRQHPMLGHTLGSVLILRGDARCLPIGSADHIITSPPYEGINDDSRPFGGLKDPTANVNKAARFGPGSMAHRYTRPVDAVVSSPPFMEIVHSTNNSSSFPNASAKGLTRQEYDLNKPPYDHRGMGVGVTERANSYNIGNLRGQAYWESMRQVYQECHRVLRPGGVMALVLGNFVRHGLIVDLVSDTINLCTQLGFEEIDHWQRLKWSLSFWRILSARKGLPVIDREDVVVFRKPLAGNGSLDSLTEKAISLSAPSQTGPAIQWGYTSAKLTSDPSPQLPLSWPKEE